MTKLYFAYGANVNVNGMQQRCPQARPLRPFELRDWQLKFYNHANIEPCAGSTVNGVLWEITANCERSLDLFEGVPVYYNKRSWTQDNIDFFFYEMSDYKSGDPSIGYIQIILEGYDQWNLPREKLLDLV